ncbi:MAG: cytochrome c oxidase subunit 3 [Cyclobacteriaceae bacterium]|nr:cytochrome c oxidase subunit 3 [Cyclobacteriaceae bacterium]
MKIVEKPERPLAMNPKKFALWLFMISIVMMFAALTSAYIVRKGDGNWRMFELPVLFWYSTAVVILSSVGMQIGVMAARKDQMAKLKWGLLSTFILGVLFLSGQFYSWKELIVGNVYFTGGNPSESFIYVLTGVHWLHLVSGLIFLGIVLFDVLKLKVHSRNMNRIEMCATYWHFLGGLWVYLFAFLLYNHQ